VTRVAAVIVNYGTATLAMQALESLLKQPSGASLDIHLVENGSPGADSAYLRRAVALHGERLTLHVLSQNRGFGAANNVVFAHLGQLATPPEYVLLLNPDAAVQTDVVRQLSTVLDGAADAAFAGPTLRQMDTGALREAAFRFPHLGTVFQRALNSAWLYHARPDWRIGIASGPKPMRADWVSGACVMARFSVIRALEGFDEGFFLYWEEVDLMHRASKEAWHTWHVPQAEALHIEGAATGQSTQREERIDHPVCYYESWQRFFRKSRGRTYTLCAAMFWIGGTWLYHARCRVNGDTPIGAPRNAIRYIVKQIVLPTLRFWRR